MHEDYELAYCPIAHITSLAFADDAFESARLTPELLHKLRVPARFHALPLRFKKSMWDIPIFRRTIQTVSGIHTHPTQPMQYRTANDALMRLDFGKRRCRRIGFGYTARLRRLCSVELWVDKPARRHNHSSGLQEAKGKKQ